MGWRDRRRHGPPQAPADHQHRDRRHLGPVLGAGRHRAGLRRRAHGPARGAAGVLGTERPARSASIARLVPEEELPAANALGSTVMQTGQIAGPLLAGALIPVVGLAELYLIDALALCVTVWAVHRLPALPPLDATVARRAGLREILDGFRYISGHAVLLLSFVADIVAMVLGMPRALFPQLAAETYASYGEGFALGLLFAAIPIGAVAGGLFSGTFSRPAGTAGWSSAPWWCGRRRHGSGLSDSLWIAVAFLAVAGIADMVSMVFRGAILLSVATDEMRGRMQGVFTVVVAGGPGSPTSCTAPPVPPSAPVPRWRAAGSWSSW
ncbi:MFS transporter [Streptomyces sp. INA 01156]